MSDFGDYVERLRRADKALDQLLAEAIERHNKGDYQTERSDDREVHRLRGKREGIRLALSYAEDGL